MYSIHTSFRGYVMNSSNSIIVISVENTLPAINYPCSYLKHTCDRKLEQRFFPLLGPFGPPNILQLMHRPDCSFKHIFYKNPILKTCWLNMFLLLLLLLLCTCNYDQPEEDHFYTLPHTEV